MGNKLPHPVTIFLWLTLAVIVASEVVSRLGITVDFYDAKAKADASIGAVSLMNKEGLYYMFTSAKKNFTGFAPLGTVLVAMLGVGVSGGFSANLLLGSIDPLLAGITNEALAVGGFDFTIGPEANLYFMMVSTFLLTFLGWFVTDKIVEPRLGEYKGSHKAESMEVTSEEKRGFVAAGISILVFAVIMLILTVPQNAMLRVDGNLKGFIGSGLVPTIMLFFMIPGLVFGKVSGSIKSDKDVVRFMSKAMSSMGGYLVLAIAAAQFVAYFGHSNLGIILAVSGANLLKAIGLGGLPLIIGFILVSAFINLFIGSASAKWSIMAPIFVPMLLLSGINPEFTQLAYRIGDSTTNIISPLMSYFAVIVTFAQKYDEDTGIGTLISTMLPYSIVFLLGWTVLLMAWYFIGLPIGPEAFMR